MAHNAGKPFGDRGSAADPAGGAYSAPPDPVAGGRGLAAPLPQKPHPSSLRALALHPLQCIMMMHCLQVSSSSVDCRSDAAGTVDEPRQVIG